MELAADASMLKMATATGIEMVGYRDSTSRVTNSFVEPNGLLALRSPVSSNKPTSIFPRSYPSCSRTSPSRMYRWRGSAGGGFSEEEATAPGRAYLGQAPASNHS